MSDPTVHVRPATPTGATPGSTRASRLAGPVLAAGLALGVCLVVGLVDPTRPNHLFPLCPFKALTGWDCPGCGATRALHALLHGDLSAAMRFNALVVVLLPYLLWRYAGWTRAQWRASVSGERHLTPVLVRALLVAVVLWWVARNIPWGPLRHLYV